MGYVQYYSLTVISLSIIKIKMHEDALRMFCDPVVTS